MAMSASADKDGERALPLYRDESESERDDDADTRARV